MLSKNVLVPIANGNEEIEVITIVDILRRANVGVRVASIEDREITGANGIKIVADSDFVDEVVDDYDAIILPGGTEGAKRYVEHTSLTRALKEFHQKDLLVAAICASPALVLAPLGLLKDKKATCYPSFKDKIANYVDQPYVEDGNVVTSQGPGTAMAFALHLVKILASETTANQIKSGVLA